MTVHELREELSKIENQNAEVEMEYIAFGDEKSGDKYPQTIWNVKKDQLSGIIILS